jgi:protein-tyrosine kinase
MGEIADALRRSGPPARPETEQHHDRRKLDANQAAVFRPPAPKPLVDPQPPVETEQRSPRHPILRLMRDGKDNSQPARIGLDDPQGHCAQQYRRLAIRLRNLANARRARSIVVTSAQAGDGKTTTACNLAIALAMTDPNSRVVLVDLDLHRASIASALGIQVDTSIEDVLRDDVPLERATMETDVDGLFIVAAGSPARKPDQLLANQALAATIAELESRFDWVIIDTPPILATSDAQVILQHAATALLVVREGVSPVRALREALGHVSKGKVLASCLNSSRKKSQRYGSYADYHANSEDLEPALSIDPEEKDDLDVE